MADRTIALLTPESAHFPASNFGALTLLNQRPVIAFDASTVETIYFTIPAIRGIVTPVKIVVTYCMASATSGAVVVGCQVEAISDGDATDIDAGTSFDTTNDSSATTVPGTAGYIDQISVTLTNNDSITAADLTRLAFARRATDAGDTATGDMYLVQIELCDDGG